MPAHADPFVCMYEHSGSGTSEPEQHAMPERHLNVERYQRTSSLKTTCVPVQNILLGHEVSGSGAVGAAGAVTGATGATGKQAERYVAKIGDVGLLVVSCMCVCGGVREGWWHQHAKSHNPLIPITYVQLTTKSATLPKPWPRTYARLCFVAQSLPHIPVFV